MYGFKSSGCQWNKTITKSLTERKFQQFTTNPGVFFKKKKKKLKNKIACVRGLYIDDIANQKVKISRSLKNCFKN